MSETLHPIGIKDRRSPTGQIDWTEPFITKTELARHMGFSTRWVERRVKDGMPHYRVGGRLRFQKSQSIAWVLQQED